MSVFIADQQQSRERDFEEINQLAIELGYINGGDRSVYDDLLATYFPHVTSARQLVEHERIQWLTMLRLWRQGDHISRKTQAAIDGALERRTA